MMYLSRFKDKDSTIGTLPYWIIFHLATPPESDTPGIHIGFQLGRKDWIAVKDSGDAF